MRICELSAADWRRFGRPLLVFSDVFAGPMAAYVTLPHYYGSKIAHWMLNEDEFVNEVSSCGYRGQLKTPCNVKSLGEEGKLPMDTCLPKCV
jgi:hypothetical protein